MSENNLQDLHKLIDDTNGNVVVIKPFETDDLYLGKKISASVTEGGHFSQISIGNRNHVFSRKTGEWAGSDIDCVSKSTQEAETSDNNSHNEIIEILAINKFSEKYKLCNEFARGETINDFVVSQEDIDDRNNQIKNIRDIQRQLNEMINTLPGDTNGKITKENVGSTDSFRAIANVANCLAQYVKTLEKFFFEFKNYKINTYIREISDAVNCKAFKKF